MKRSVWIMFAGFCALSASEWLLAPVPAWVHGLVYLIVGLAAWVVNGRSQWSRWSDIAQLAVAAVLLLAIPQAIAGWAAGHVSVDLRTAVLALVPAMVVIVEMSSMDGSSARSFLVPALVGLSGILLLVPFGLPGSLAGRFALAIVVASSILVAIASVRIRRLLLAFSLCQSVAVFCLANGLVLLVIGFFVGWGGVEFGGWFAVLAAGVEALLLVALLRGMEPVRLAGRFLVVPLLTIVEGFVLLRPGLTLRMGVGAALLTGGAGMMLLLRGREEGASLSLR